MTGMTRGRFCQTRSDWCRNRAVTSVATLSILFVALAALPGHAQQQYQDNVVIVLDASGSMAEQMRAVQLKKMDVAKAALKKVLTNVPETTNIGLLVFSAKNLRDPWAFPLGPRDDEALMSAVDLPVPGGGTPLGQYIKIGADRLLQERAKQYGYGSYRLIVVTDGEASDMNVMNRNVPEVMSRGILIDAIGVDMKGNHTLATKVHSYRRADDPQALAQALAEVLGEVVTSGDAGGDAEEDAFELLAAIPSEVAGSMLEALTQASNAPIGQGPVPPRQPRAQTGPPQQQNRAAAVPPRRPGTPPQRSLPSGSQGTSSNGGGSGFGKIFIWFIVFLIIISGARKATKRRG